MYSSPLSFSKQVPPLRHGLESQAWERMAQLNEHETKRHRLKNLCTQANKKKQGLRSFRRQTMFWRLPFLCANLATLSTLASLSKLCIRKIAKDESRSSVIVLRSEVFILFIELKLRSSAQAEIG